MALDITRTILNTRQAKHICDMQRVKALQAFLKDTTQQACMPYHLAGTIVVPNPDYPSKNCNHRDCVNGHPRFKPEGL